jgi:hypothetical protein
MGIDSHSVVPVKNDPIGIAIHNKNEQYPRYSKKWPSEANPEKFLSAWIRLRNKHSTQQNENPPNDRRQDYADHAERQKVHDDAKDNHSHQA